MKRILNKITITSIVFLLCISLLSSVAQAYSVAFTFEGWGVRGLPSIGSAYINNQQYVRVIHTQVRDYPLYSGALKIIVERKVWWGWSSVTSKMWNNDVYNAYWYPWLSSSGEYRLYFTSVSSVGAQSFYIKGSFSK